ncbi:hypothetical protein F2Q69_00036805 [Brassica cretica]|uniref:Uncharacterized protein n=1 Tax=Brassica cretica TaxID=69181 RepID=A0A8S9SR06_BRACR|nr:hypothetical protein F2Q69_00036805 [Brassica cretica]
MTSLSQTSTAASYWEFGLKKADQQIILDDFNKYDPGWVYSKQQGCVNEGAALGRGAATSGFNKFIELTIKYFCFNFNCCQLLGICESEISRAKALLKIQWQTLIMSRRNSHGGLKKADQQIILDDFNKYDPGWVYSKQQGCVNEGAALGRGAATSGFNKFIELTEAAKDLKDGSLSQ